MLLTLLVTGKSSIKEITNSCRYIQPGASPRIFEWGDKSSAVWPAYPKNLKKKRKTPDLGHFILESGRFLLTFHCGGRVPPPRFRRPWVQQTSFRHGCRKRGDGGDASPPVKNLGGDVPSRFENEVAQIRRLIRFLGYFGGRLATRRRSVPTTQKSVATPLLLGTH